jgi:hypothetical protein
MRVTANQFKVAVGVVALAGLALSTTALAAPVSCLNTANNHMIIDDAQVTRCLDAGVRNITGQNHNDLFINNGTTGDGYVSAGKTDGANPFTISYTQSRSGANTIGTFSLDASFWDDALSGAIGFKFGTGGRQRPDQWFVFELQQGVTSGRFEFVNVFGRGGDLSHVNLYRVPGVAVAEPSGLVLLGLGVVGAGLARRRIKPV